MARFLATGALLLIAATVGAAEMSPDRINELVQMFDPNTRVPIENAFQHPASDISDQVQSATIFVSLMFAPFLVLPILLLLVVIFKFRDRGDGRQPATFIHNDKLEIFWTAVPILVVVIVSIPITRLIYVTDLPPANAERRDPMEVVVIGSQFKWTYEYPGYGVQIGYDDLRQQPVVLQKDRLTTLHITSSDVNHAWAVPVFGIKKDAFPAPRFNYAWFTPNRTGFFDGQCYELCGEDHGKMIITSVVAEEPDFQAWIGFQRNRFDAKEVVALLRATDEGGDAAAEEALELGIAGYFADDRSETRRNALLYWAGYSYNLEAGDRAIAGDKPGAAAVRELGEEQRAVLRNLIQTTIARLEAAPVEAAPTEPVDDATDDAAAAPAPQAGAQEG